MQISILKEYAFHHMTMTRDFVWFRTLQNILGLFIYDVYLGDTSGHVRVRHQRRKYVFSHGTIPEYRIVLGW